MFSARLGDDLELRLLDFHHAESLFALVEANRAHLRRWLGWVDNTNGLYDTESYIRRALQQHASNDGLQTSIWYKSELAGQIGHNFIDWPDRKTELGYWLAAGFQGKGLMTRACRALIDYSFYDLHLNRVEILCADGNARSRAIPARLGFIQEGILRQAEWRYDHWDDLVVYGLLAEEWPRLRAGLRPPEGKGHP